MPKVYPNIGDKLYLKQVNSSYYCNLVKRPYTVVKIEGGHVYVQACKLIAPVYHCSDHPHNSQPELEGKRVFFYDTVAEKIEEDPNGEIEKLSWSPKKQRWQVDRYKTGYPEVAFFGKWEHFPYLD